MAVTAHTIAAGDATATAASVASTTVAPGSLGLWWLSGAGFVLKTSAGTQLYIDPYFSNCVQTIFGIDRAVPPPIPVTAAQPDLVLATHWHEDHLDPAALPQLAQRRDQTEFLCPPTCRSRLLGWGVPAPRVHAITAGESYTFRDVYITAVPARHEAGVKGWEVPDAVGYLIEAEGLRLYHTGDTEYDLRLRALAYDREHPIDIMLAVINGAGGNMNAHEAALLAWHIHPEVLIPMHHILWRAATGGEQATLDPALLVDTYHKLGGRGAVLQPAVGAGLLLRKETQV